MNSRLDWAGGLSESWDVVPLKFVARRGTGHTPDRKRSEYWEECTIPWVTIPDATARRGSLDPIFGTSQSISELGLRNSSAELNPAGTVMLSRTASIGHSVLIGRPMATTQDFVTWRCGPDLLPEYLLLVLRAMKYEWIRLAYGSTHKTIYMPDLEQVRIPLPTTDEQRRIVKFVYFEQQRFDKTLDSMSSVRRSLQERRISGVYNSVTAQLISERKPSRIPWVTTIPANWRSAKVSYFARLGSGHTPSRSHPEWWVDCTIPWVTTGEVSQMRSDRLEVLNETREMISEVGLENSSAEVHPRGTVVLCRTAASAGYSAVMGQDMATSQDLATWRCGAELDPFYLLWCLRAMRVDLLERLAFGSTHKTIYMPDLQSLRIPLPAREEQEQIVRSIREKNHQIDDCIDAIDAQVELLSERREALITAAVTGQIDVTTARGVDV